ncbi:MAG: DUF4397 domain-containing protein [Candidatus Eremiobacteraeota bacterium]|nr:DUF4397 domain-containing protein [Candidatus Eremiobacteraeota bacterium]
MLLTLAFYARRSNAARVLQLAFIAATFFIEGCSGSSSGGTSLPSSGTGVAEVRFLDGAPVLEALVNGVPSDIGAAYLQSDGQTVMSSFAYGTLSTFTALTPGVHSLKALDALGYAVGPLKTASLAAGKRYTLILVGAYPNYQVLNFEEPPGNNGAQVSLYEASPAVPNAEYGHFRASSHTNFQRLGAAILGNVATASLGKSVSDLGGYVAAGSRQLGTVTPAQVDGFDSRNVLPFHRASRLSLFLCDPKPGSGVGPVFGSIDR